MKTVNSPRSNKIHRQYVSTAVKETLLESGRNYSGASSVRSNKNNRKEMIASRGQKEKRSSISSTVVDVEKKSRMIEPRISDAASNAVSTPIGSRNPIMNAPNGFTIAK